MEASNKKAKAHISQLDTIPNETNDLLIDLVNKKRENLRKTIDITIKENKSAFKSIFSKKKFRFDYEGFDLDLSYITERIIAMGFPSQNLEKIYRNSVNDVKKFFDKRHPNKYKVFNLCSERTYPEDTFYRQANYPFDDHQAPPINIFIPFCKDVEFWLNEDPSHIATIHCKAGKGRTGTMICAYLLYSGFVNSADNAIQFFGMMRTQNGKGVTIPSQLRYIYYFENIFKSKIDYPLQSPKLILTKIKLYGIPKNECTPYFKINNNHFQYSYKDYYKLIKYKNEPFADLNVDNLSLCGDVKIRFFNKKLISKDKLFSIWFNTYFLPDDGIFSIKKSMIDGAHKDKKNKIFDWNFKIELYYKAPEQISSSIDISPITDMRTFKI